MPKAIWNGEVIAESGDTKVVEGNHYFPRGSVNAQYLRDSGTRTHCPWKGDASYYHLDVGGKVNKDAAWYYPTRARKRRRSAITSRSGKASR